MLKARSAAAVLALAAFATSLVLAADIPSVDEIMTKAHKSKTGLRDLIKKEIDGGSPNWADVQKKTKEFVTLAEALAKNDPPKGDKASWKKLSEQYASEVKALDAAAGKKDPKAVADANKKLGANCKGCHDAHQP